MRHWERRAGEGPRRSAESLIKLVYFLGDFLESVVATGA